MGVMTVRNVDEVIALNRKQRNKMSVVKEGLEVSEVLIQEGVHSFETLNEAVAEPVIYMIDRYVVGGFYRVHRARQGREPQRPGHAFRAAGLRDRLQPARLPLRQPDRPPTASTPTAWSVAWPAWRRPSNSSARRPKPTRPDPQRGPATAF
jgi:glutamate--cysteine ligase